ncbi:polysaccharide deacetylase family protein [Spirulina subsalsa]|uniref:polysaccharide deacetylase family protein n=1 Tax=Spirulina subsalsa TaxID=54311 RepID=UPI00031F9ADB|nr:polysaccharide deacetylase family protein [Spirulina subsalsa]
MNLKGLIRQGKWVLVFFGVLLAVTIGGFLALPKIPVFGFHNVIAPPYDSPSYIDYDVNELEEFLVYLVTHDYWFLDTDSLDKYFLNQTETIPEVYRNRQPVLLTFDDGYISMYEILLPLLKKLEQIYETKVKVVLFVSPGLNSSKYLSCEQMRVGYEEGFFDIQSHGWSHVRLTKLGKEALEVELKKSQVAIQECLEQEDAGLHFAYPFNDASFTVRRLTGKYYKSGYLYNNQFFRLWPFQDAYSLPRLRAFYQDSPEKLIRLVGQGMKVS